MMPTETAAGRFAALKDWQPPDLVDAMLEGQMAAVAATLAAAGLGPRDVVIGLAASGRTP